MTDVSGGFGVDDGAHEGPVPLHHPAGGPPPRSGEERARFGRGWIPGDRDIGVPEDDLGSGRGEGLRAAEGDPSLRRDDDCVPRDEGASHTAWDAERKVRFLDHLAGKGDVSSACARVGMSRTSAYLLRRRDAAFAAGWQAALVLARQHVEEVLATRALDGTEEAVWFRGELVGTRRKYDSRLLLAHLARLDRQALEEEGGVQAGRFNELLALVAGERPDPDLCHEHAAPDELPMARADYVEGATREFIVANEAWFEAVEAIDVAYEDEHGFAPGEQDDESEAAAPDPGYPPAPDPARYRAASAARWDGWQSRAFGRVDALLAGALEYKSMDGPAGEGAGKDALDRVNRVNLAVRRRRGAARQKVAAAGNAWAGSPLSLVKAGAALPPLPSCAGRHFPPTDPVIARAATVAPNPPSSPRTRGSGFLAPSREVEGTSGAPAFARATKGGAGQAGAGRAERGLSR